MSFRNRWQPLIVTALLILLPVAAKAAGEPFWISIGSRIVIVGMAVISLDLVLGYGGMPSFGHAAFFGLGGYTTAILGGLAANMPAGSWGRLLGEEALVNWPLAVLVSALAGLVIGAFALRTRGIHFLMITLAFSQMIYYVFMALPSYGGDEGVRMNNRQHLLGFDLSEPVVFYYVSTVGLLGVIALSRLIVRSRFGRVLAGCRQNERRMRFLGYRTNSYMLAAFTLSAAGTGLAGALMVNLQRYVSPQSLSWFQSGEFMVMNVLGGMASTYGGVLGAAVFLILQELLIGVTEHWEVFLGAGLLALVLSGSGGVLRLLGPSRAGHAR